MHHRPLAGLKLEVQAHGLQRQQQVGKDDGRVHAQLLGGGDGDLGGQLRLLADFHQGVVLADVAVLLHVAAGLAQKPDRRAVHRAGADRRGQSGCRQGSSWGWFRRRGLVDRMHTELILPGGAQAQPGWPHPRSAITATKSSRGSCSCAAMRRPPSQGRRYRRCRRASRRRSCRKRWRACAPCRSDFAQRDQAVGESIAHRVFNRPSLADGLLRIVVANFFPLPVGVDEVSPGRPQLRQVRCRKRWTTLGKAGSRSKPLAHSSSPKAPVVSSGTVWADRLSAGISCAIQLPRTAR